MTAPARFTQADVTRLVKGAQAAGLDVRSVRVAPSGELVASAIGEAQVIDLTANPLDRLLLNGPS
ncbi:hypothetical protein [Novosphingobium sp.]|uniref:hypothetical protein n=1 Tax=Novosphingobium sp. TaxID=1874826 RepID=UPI003D0ACD23